MDLEKYLIPAEEGFFTSDVYTENLHLLKEGYPLFAFIPANDSKKFESRFLKYQKMVNASYTFLIPPIFPFYCEADFGGDKVDDFIHDVAVDHPEIAKELDAFVKRFNKLKESNRDLHHLYQFLIEMCIKCFKKYKVFFVIILDEELYIKYAIRCVGASPVFFGNPSTLQKFFTRLSQIPRDIYQSNEDFDRAFGRNIPKKLFIKDHIDLYHVSKNKLSKLEPRRTYKPLNESENMTIPRISACDNVDACFKAVNATPGLWYVYKLKLTKDSKVVKPNTYLVPDADITGEYWVLTPTEVELVTTIQCKVDPKNSLRYEFIERKNKSILSELKGGWIKDEED